MDLIRPSAMARVFSSVHAFAQALPFPPRVCSPWKIGVRARASIFTSEQPGNRQIVLTKSCARFTNEHFMQIYLPSREPREFGIEASPSKQTAEHGFEEGWVTGNCRLAEIQCR